MSKSVLNKILSRADSSNVVYQARPPSNGLPLSLAEDVSSLVVTPPYPRPGLAANKQSIVS